MRTLWRHRAGLVAEASSCIQRIQKCLAQMNIQIAHVISDLSGVTGMAILRALLAGERDPGKLAVLAQPGIKASQQDIAESLRGHWRTEILFVMRQELELYDNFRLKIGECDNQLEIHLKTMPPRQGKTQALAGPRPRGKRARGNAPKFNLREHLFQITGVDWTRVDGVDVMTAQTVIAETGVDMSRWPTEKHFTSWLGLCPDNRISGGKVLSSHTRHVIHPVADALRLAAATLQNSKTALGAFYRRMRGRLGAASAITDGSEPKSCAR